MIGDVRFRREGRIISTPADLYHDSVVVINPQSGMVIGRFKTGRRPYRILFHPDGKSFFVTNWADGTMGHYDTATGEPTGAVPLGAHPTDMVWRTWRRRRRPTPDEGQLRRAPVRGRGQYQ